MKVEVGSFTLSDANPYPYELNDSTLQIKLLIFVAGKDSSNGTNLSIGATDGTHERVVSTLYDTSKKNDYDSAKSLLHYLNVSGTATKKLDASDVDISTAGQFSVGTVTNYDASIPIMYIAIGE